MSKTFKTSVIFSVSAVWLVLMRILFSHINIGDYLSDWLFSFSVQVIGMGVIPLTLYRFWVKEEPFRAFYFRRRLSPIVYILTIVTGVVVSLLLTSFSALWQTVLHLIGYTMTNSPGTVYPSVGAVGILFMELLTTAVLPGIFEEINYRGLGMQLFDKVEDERMKIIFIGVLFGLGHQFIAQTGYAFLAGVIFAYLVIKTRSIIPGMIIHFMNNAISVLTEYSMQTTGFFYSLREKVLSVFFKNFLFLLLFMMALAVLTIVLLRLIRKYSQGAENAVAEKKDEYYYPNKKQYVDDIFGDLEAVRETSKPSVRWYEYAPLYGAIAIMVINTVFTFVWGMGR